LFCKYIFCKVCIYCNPSILCSLLTKQTEYGYTGCFVMFSVITNICNKKTKGPTLMELFTATGKLIFFFKYS